MDPEEQERRRRYIEDMREMLRDMDAADRLAASSSMAEPESRLTQSFSDMPLLSSTRSQRWRREALEIEQRHAAAEAERKREEQKILRQREQAARVELTEEWTEVLGQVIAEERQRMREHVAEQLGLLRAELTVQREAERGQIIDLPSFPAPRKRDPHAA